ncbi:hypothetical protein B0H13DRAFT_2330412 [Mycena leptocephala]|nr:hypothetical protein B0H13DRAFT_2330412 [Mycena leptocephala]
MANLSQSTTPASRSDPELEALVALVQRLAVASSEATRLATEVQAKLPSTLNRHAASTTTWIRGVPRTPGQVEAAFPEGSGEVWYVVIRGREPGMYRTPTEANAQTDGVPHQFREKKKTRREALAFYRENYHATANYDTLAAAATTAGAPLPVGVPLGVQKWIGIPVAPAGTQ